MQFAKWPHSYLIMIDHPGFGRLIFDDDIAVDITHSFIGWGQWFNYQSNILGSPKLTVDGEVMSLGGLMTSKKCHVPSHFMRCSLT